MYDHQQMIFRCCGNGIFQPFRPFLAAGLHKTELHSFDSPLLVSAEHLIQIIGLQVHPVDIQDHSYPFFLGIVQMIPDIHIAGAHGASALHIRKLSFIGHHRAVALIVFRAVPSGIVHDVGNIVFRGKIDAVDGIFIRQFCLPDQSSGFDPGGILDGALIRQIHHQRLIGLKFSDLIGHADSSPGCLKRR